MEDARRDDVVDDSIISFEMIIIYYVELFSIEQRLLQSHLMVRLFGLGSWIWLNLWG
jgi:hypothetical protein